MHLALGVEYDGGAFKGYQRQNNVPSVQEALEDALGQIADRPVHLIAAGRTDSGVHATHQVIGFEAPVERPMSAWLRGTNSLTPNTVKVRWAHTVDAQFHARFSATSRRYMYLFYEQTVRSPLLDAHAVQTQPLDDDAMHVAAQWLVGEHDFTSFRGAGCQSNTPFRRVHRIAVHRTGPLVVVDVTANAFLMHMVRNICAALWQVGCGRRPAGWLADLLAARDRRHTGPTAPPQGLYLVDVCYPEHDLPAGMAPGLLRSLGSLAVAFEGRFRSG